MYWITLLCCLLLCLGCARAGPPSPGASPEVFLATMQQRMEAGLEILYFSAKVDQYYAQCLQQYPTLKAPLDAGYHTFQLRHAQLSAAARRYVLLPAAFAPFAEPADRERIDALVGTGIPAQAAHVVTNELAEGSAAARYAQCAFFPIDVLAGAYDIATRAPEAVKLIQGAEDALARERRTRGTSSTPTVGSPSLTENPSPSDTPPVAPVLRSQTVRRRPGSSQRTPCSLAHDRL